MQTDQQYYESLIIQGHPPEHALHYTRMYYPTFVPQIAQTSPLTHANYFVPVVQETKKDRTVLIVIGVAVFAIIVVAMLILAVIAVALFDSADNTPEFGFRHDVSSQLFEDLGENKAPYDSNDYPDFSSVVYLSLIHI